MAQCIAKVGRSSESTQMIDITFKFWTPAASFLTLIVTLMLTQPAGADDIAEDRRVWLGNSAFDLRMDPERFEGAERDFYFSLSPFVKEFMVAEQNQVGLLFRVSYREKKPGIVRGWEPEAAVLVAEGEPVVNDGFGNSLVADGLTTLKASSGFIYTSDAPQAFYGSCSSYVRADDDVGCYVVIRYAFDDTLRLFVTAMPPEGRDLADFEAIAIAFHNFVKCELDVTPTNSPRQMRPQDQIAPEFLAPCTAPIS